MPAAASDASPAEDAGAEVINLHCRARVGPGGRISLSSPHLKQGQEVVIEINLPATGRSGLEIIESLGGGRRVFKSAEEVDAYLAEERASWDR